MMQPRDPSGSGQPSNLFVLDANIIFDLHGVGILGHIFRLGSGFVTTDLIEKELKSINLVMLRGFGLRVVSLNGPQVAEVYRLKQEYRSSPSHNDLSAFVYARDNGIDLITRDGGLWQVANDCGVVVHETPKLIQDMVGEGILDCTEAADYLERILSKHPVDRLDWRDKIKAWRKR